MTNQGPSASPSPITKVWLLGKGEPPQMGQPSVADDIRRQYRYFKKPSDGGSWLGKQIFYPSSLNLQWVMQRVRVRDYTIPGTVEVAAASLYSGSSSSNPLLSSVRLHCDSGGSDNVSVILTSLFWGLNLVVLLATQFSFSSLDLA